jgi:hypothetical protein
VRPFGDANVRHKKPYELQDQLQELQKNLIAKEKFIAVPHHTNAVSETRRTDGTPYWYEYAFRKPDNYHRLIEVFQARGNMERNEYTDAWRGWYGEHASVQDALALGYKLGFTAGTDCHAGRPVRCHTAIEDLGRVPLHCQSVTGVWADVIDRQSIFDGLYHRHTWACWDTRTIVWFSVNEALMGSNIHVENGGPLTARIRMSTDYVIQSLEIISGGKSVWVGSFDELDFDVTIDLGTATEDTFFYIRALLRNGGIVYGSPVFVTIT